VGLWRLEQWSIESLVKENLLLGFVAHQQTANTSGKNASDIDVSSDSDFTSVANGLHGDGLIPLPVTSHGERGLLPKSQSLS
jgi:hypothetical protein